MPTGCAWAPAWPGAWKSRDYIGPKPRKHFIDPPPSGYELNNHVHINYVYNEKLIPNYTINLFGITNQNKPADKNFNKRHYIELKNQ